MKRVLFAVVFIAACSTIGSAQQYTYYFPQVTAGFYSGGSWKTTIFITNSSSPGVGSGAITFTQSDGGPYNITFLDESGNTASFGNSIPFQLGPGETRKFVSVVDSPLKTGYAKVTTNTAVLGTAMFTQFNSTGTMIGEAGVPAAIPLGKQAIFVDTTGDFKTAVAIANPNSSPLQIHLELLNSAGQMVTSTVRTLGAFQHTAFFVHELFPGMSAMVGRLQFYCTNPMTSVGLRFDPSFALFTTMPPVAVQ